MSKNKEEALSDSEKADRLNELKTLGKDDKIFEKLQTNNKQLEKFLYGTDFDVQKAYNKIKDYYEMVREHPDFFPVLGPLDKKSMIETNIRIMIPQYDKEGRRICITKLANIDVDTMYMTDLLAMDDVLLESALEDNPRVAEKGLCVIMDIANYPWRLIKWSTPEYTKLCSEKLMLLPFKEYRIHVVNTSTLIHIGMKIIWPFIPAYMKEMVKFHFNDWESLYKYIDKDALPPEYGGTYDVNYNEIYQQLYKKNEEILAITKFRREVVS